MARQRTTKPNFDETKLQGILRRVFRIDRVRRTQITVVRETAFARPLGTGAGPAEPE